MCPFQNVYVGDLPPKVMLFGDRAFGKYLGLDEVMRVGPLDTWD